MSFGFSVGDFIAVIELTNRIRKKFVDAPDQFKAISDEVRSLSIVLQDAEDRLSGPDLDNRQERDITNSCCDVLTQLYMALFHRRALTIATRKEYTEIVRILKAHKSFNKV